MNRQNKSSISNFLWNWPRMVQKFIKYCKRPMERLAWRKDRCSGFSVFRKAVKTPRTIQYQDAPPLCAKMKTLIACVLLCSVTTEWLLKLHQKHLVWESHPLTKFWIKIWKLRRLAQRCQNCWLLSKRCDGKNLALIGKLQTTAMSSCKELSPGTKLGFTNIRHWAEVTEQRVQKKEKALKNKAKIKFILIRYVFWLPWKCAPRFVPKGQSVNAAFYVEVVKSMKDHVCHIRPNLSKESWWILHHDNTPVHSALIVCKVLAHSSITLLEHFPYSPDLASLQLFFCSPNAN